MAGDATAPEDYDRACEVDDLAGVITVGDNGAQALVLAAEPATSCYLPERRAFLRWLATVCRVIQRLGPLLAIEPARASQVAAERLWIVEGTLIAVRDRTVGACSRNTGSR